MSETVDCITKCLHWSQSAEEWVWGWALIIGHPNSAAAKVLIGREEQRVASVSSNPKDIALQRHRWSKAIIVQNNLSAGEHMCTIQGVSNSRVIIFADVCHSCEENTVYTALCDMNVQ